MPLQPDNILKFLHRQVALRDARRFVVAFSGGMDSTVLLDLARRALPHWPGASLLAVHVDHNLHQSSRSWSEHCAATARQFGVSYVTCQVHVARTGGESPEAAARAARYDALATHIGPGDVLMCAHHRDDQVETVLLQLARGAGVAGLSGMPECAGFADGWCVRPLLSTSRSELADYAAKHRLQWIDDPSNVDRSLDRNFLRHEILPGLSRRWPAATKAIARSARHCASATRLLREIGAADAGLISIGAGVVDLEILGTLSVERQDNALRCWLREQNLTVPSTAHFGQLRKLLRKSTRTGSVSWPGCELKRYRSRLYATTVPAYDLGDFCAELIAESVVQLPAGLGQLRCSRVPNGGLDPAVCGNTLTVRFRAGGERLRPAGGAHRRQLRTLYQEAGIVPWMRDRIPLIFVNEAVNEGAGEGGNGVANDRLAAVADLWLEHDLTAGQGVRGLQLTWENHPPLY